MKGEQYQTTSAKWANRGDSKQWHTEFYKAKKDGPEVLEEALRLGLSLRACRCSWVGDPMASHRCGKQPCTCAIDCDRWAVYSER